MYKKHLRIPDLSHRSSELEAMDLCDSDHNKLHKTLLNFKIINKYLSRIQPLLAATIIRHAICNKLRFLRCVDIGAGGADSGVWLVNECKRKGIDVDLVCIDHDPRVIQFAQQQCKDISNIRFICSDVQHIDSHIECCDFIFSNYLLHHLNDEDIIRLLVQSKNLATVGFIFNDIERNYQTFFGYAAMSVFMKKNDSFTHEDGKLSIKKGFTLQELHAFCTKADLTKEVIKKRWPGHIAIVYFNRTNSAR